MSYCINPLCAHRENVDNVDTCISCGTSLLINNRIRLIKPLRPLTDDPHSYFEVFEIEDFGTQLNPVRKRRVVKVLKWNSSKLREMIEKESITLRRIRHPNIPRSSIDDFFAFVPNNSPLELRCLVMDKIEGQNLAEWLESNGRISQSVALDWLQQLVKILDVVHHTEFFHRDIKPTNIILQPDGQLALVDFGTARRVTDTYLSKVSGSGGTSKRVGTYEITSVITACYTPPEQINGKAVPQSDFYALGRTFVNLLTGISLLDLPTDEITGNLIWRNKAPQIDKPFADFIDELMAPFPGQRPQTTEVILQRLNKLPQQIENYKLTHSKVFKYSKRILISLGFLGVVFLSIPLLTNYLIVQGQKLEAANNSQDAQKFFKWAIKINPQIKFEVSEFYFGRASRNIDNPKIARKYFEQSLQYNSKDAAAYSNLALVCQRLQDVKCVVENYEKAFKLKPNNWESHYGLGNFYEDQQKYDLAQKEYQLAIQESDEAVLAVAALSRLKNKNSEHDAAVALALQGLKKTKDPEIQAALYKDIGWARLKQNKLNEAKEYLEKAIKLDGRTDAFCLLSQAEEALGDIDTARIYIEGCMLAQSNLPEVFSWRQQLLDRILKK
ncbi:serine/threonine-protein kinase [Nostoc sp. FACHB-145]|uniref:protein kinase domain-containing protein n=1 Tax=Nostoc sp. FACHB-145 TaxID=2692836 RepID=UPI001685A050|nr:serine/threonine-protein kinase [Nostoc sp. FACHB-145]MBD2472609.1 protein kinase [Nostoc sp. FACHB-145]